MRRTPEAEVETVGNDSFLDVVSNIVGILILLVMIVGSRVKDFSAEEEGAKSGDEQKLASAESAKAKSERDAANVLVADVQRLRSDLTDLTARTAGVKRERDELGVLAATVEAELATYRGKLDDQAKRRFDLGRDLAAARAKLGDLQRQQMSLISQPAPQVKIVSYPTPLSKTVQNQEEHFRLLGNRLVRVPFNELKEALLDERRQLIWKLRDQVEVSGEVGPIDGFRLQYELVRTPTGGGNFTALFYPTAAEMGESMELALAPDSAFHRAINRLDRANATLTVWVYPDSFGAFRQLKKELYRLGFAVAARPLPEDGKIGFSSHGSKSASQ